MKPVCVMVPLGVVTETFPELPVFTMAEIPLAESTVKVKAAVPPKLTVEAAVKLLPVIVIFVPFTPVLGVNPAMEGPIWVNPFNEADPKGVVTVKLPVAPVPTTATMVVGEETWKEAALAPPNNIFVAPVKLVPVMVTLVPLLPEVGEKLVTVGGLPNTNPSIEVVPADVVTAILPVVPVPTMAVILPAESTVKDLAAVPPNFTEVVPENPSPVILTEVPTVPIMGSTLAMVGPLYVNMAALVPVAALALDVTPAGNAPVT